MKRWTGNRLLSAALALLLVLGAIALPLSDARAEAALASGFVNSTTLNMRPDASTHQPIVTTLKRGDAVNVYEVLGNWLRVDAPKAGKSGYVSGKYVSLQANTGFYGLGYTTNPVHVRTDATAESESKGVLESKTGLTLLSISPNGWWKVKALTGGLEGFVSKSYVTVVSKTVKSAQDAGAVSGGTATGTATITGSGVNFRTGPSAKDKSQGLLYKGTAVTVLGSSGNWYQVKVVSTGKTGYVSKKFVQISSSNTSAPTVTAGPVASGTTAYINAGGVNFRVGPSTKNKSQGQLAKNTAVTVTGASGSWYQVKVTSSGKSGYVYKTYVTISTTTVTAAPTATPFGATPTPAVTAAPGSASAYINAGGVNFRTGPSTKYKTQGTLAKNTTVTVLGRSGSWYQVQVPATGLTGYVYKTYVTAAAGVTLPDSGPSGVYDAGAVN